MLSVKIAGQTFHNNIMAAVNMGDGHERFGLILEQVSSSVVLLFFVIVSLLSNRSPSPHSSPH